MDLHDQAKRQKGYSIQVQSKTWQRSKRGSPVKKIVAQKFVSEFINPKTPYKGLLLYHQIGAGKTCAAVAIAENWKEKRNVLIVTPASLMGNFYKELRSECTGDEYLLPKERSELGNLNPATNKYKETIKRINKKIDKFYTVLSYNKFVEKILKRRIKFEDTILIIDEVQNIVSEHGEFYKKIKGAIDKAPSDFRIVIWN